MLKIMDIMNLVFGFIYGGLAYVGLQKVFKFEFNNTGIMATGVGVFFIGYLFALFTSNIWFIVFPVVILLALALKAKEVINKH